jgi:hypothetical protein
VPSSKRTKAGHSSDDDSSSDEEEGGRDPGKATYKEFSKTLRDLHALTCDPNTLSGEGEERSQRLRETSGRLRQLISGPVGEGEVPNHFKLLQIHLKHTLLHSQKIRDEENVKSFLCGLEDGSAGRSDDDDSVFVFLANYATELWYQWREVEKEWYWTPDRDNHMQCSSDVVTRGQWEGETPAPENVEIIAYLDALRPIPCDEQYIPHLEFDVIKVLKALTCCGETEAEENAKEVVKLWRNATNVTNDSNRNVESWLRDLKSLEEEKID